jgi:hypothetical protein
VRLVEILPLRNEWIGLNCGLSFVDYVCNCVRMERMESSIHELIAALTQNGRGNAQSQQNSPPFPMGRGNQGGTNEEGDTDEDDNITRPTAGGTDDSEERSIPFTCCLY